MNIPVWLLELLKPFLANAFAEGNAALVAAKPVIVAEVEGLATKSLPEIAAKIESILPATGIFGGIAKQVLSEYIQAELSSVLVKIQANDSTWFDELVAKVKSVEASISAAV
jgi:hypothetical protein